MTSFKKFDIKTLKNFSSNKFSQWGEDGVIEKIFEIIPIKKTNSWCVEFGAWDGVHLSNTCNLIRNKGFSSVLIEANKKKYEELCFNFPSDNTIKICKYVDIEGANNLENILSETIIPKDFDFLSIDIDGCDYHIFKSLEKYRPKVICIEYNPTIPNEVEFIQKKDFTINQGSSAKSINNLAKKKNYFLAHVSYSNLIFIDNTYKNSFSNTDLGLDAHRDDSKTKNYIFFGYDGEVLSNRYEFHLRWHDFYFNIKKIQVLPKFIRKYKGNYNQFDKIIFALYLLFTNPKTFVNKIKSKYNIK